MLRGPRSGAPGPPEDLRCVTFHDSILAGHRVPRILCEIAPRATLMPTRISFPPPGFHDLSTDEKIDYLASLWVRIRVRPATIDVPECTER